MIAKGTLNRRPTGVHAAQMRLDPSPLLVTVTVWPNRKSSCPTGSPYFSGSAPRDINTMAKNVFISRFLNAGAAPRIDVTRRTPAPTLNGFIHYEKQQILRPICNGSIFRSAKGIAKYLAVKYFPSVNFIFQVLFCSLFLPKYFWPKFGRKIHYSPAELCVATPYAIHLFLP